MDSSQVTGRDGDSIYLDYHSTTPCDPRVSELVESVSRGGFGNPSSPHTTGKSAQDLVEEARAKIAEHIGALRGEIVFTSGATESNNLAILGLVRGAVWRDSSRSRIVTSSLEHKSVLKAAEAAATQYGLEHVTIPATGEGIVDLSAAEELVDEGTLLVSVQAVNNELGTVQPVSELAELSDEAGSLFHCDAAQALGRLGFTVQDWNVDFLSLSSHKAYGPKGIGALYVSGGSNKQPIEPLMYGGGQEGGLRPGTLNVPAAVGFGEACQIVDSELASEVARTKELRDRLEDQLLEGVECARATVPRERRVASTVTVHFEGVEAEAVLARARDVAISTGSACESGAPEPSHVLEAIGYDRQSAYQCIRAAVGRFTDLHEVDEATATIASAVAGATEVSVV